MVLTAIERPLGISDLVNLLINLVDNPMLGAAVATLDDGHVDDMARILN